MAIPGLHRDPVPVRERFAAAVLTDKVIREPPPLAVAVPYNVLAVDALRGDAIAARALDAQAEVLTELPYFPETLKIPV